MVFFQMARLKVAAGIECCEAAEHSLGWATHLVAVFGILLSALIATATGSRIVEHTRAGLLG